MKARKLPLILLCGAVLTGCAEKSSESIVKPDEPQLAAVQPTTETTSIKDDVLAMIADSGENFIHFDFMPKDSSFTVSYKGTEFFTIDAGRPVDESDKIKVADYNFDGYDDIFIPDEETSFGHVLGDYYLCDPQTLDFGKSEELGVFFGRGIEMKADLTYKRLIMEYTERTSEFIVKDCALNYVWEGGRLVPHSLTKKYENADSIATAEEMFTDTYEFEDGRYEVLKERRVFKNQSNELLRTEENVGYVRVTDSAVQYMKGDAFVPKRVEVESKGQRMTYTFDDNYNTVLEKREKYDGIRHETVNELDTGDYLRVTDDAVEYMKGKSVIQSIPVSDIFPDIEPLKYSSLPAFKDELYGIKLVRMDLDFDGTRDLCVCLNPREQGEKPKYAYYLINTKAGKLERMEKLSEDGRMFTPDPFEKVLCHVETKFNEDHSTTANYYKWEGDKAVLYKREEGDSEMTKVGRYEESMRVYRIDENGNEKLSRT